MFESMIRKLIILTLFVSAIAAKAQTPYGNDWINFSQSYYKIKVSKKGIYRLNYNMLNQKISNLNTINPKNFQLFKNGKEVAIYVQGESDNSFDNTDFIEFYGEGNDGKLDKDLYPINESQPHQYYSLFTDTAAYYLTVTINTTGKRIENFKASKVGLTAQPYIIQESLGVFTETYYPGKYIIAHMSLSDYQEGEGFLGNLNWKGNQQTRTLSTPQLYTSVAAPAINFETYVAGRSDADSPHPQRMNHHLRISINNGNSTFIKKDTLFKGYAVIRTNFKLNPNELGQNTQVIYESVNDLNMSAEATDYQAAAFAKITYPRLPNLQNSENLDFYLPISAQSRLLNFSNNNKTLPIIWDITNNQRIVGEISGSNASFVISSSSDQQNLFLTDSISFNSPELTKVEITNLNPNTFNHDFIIITNKRLLSSAQNYAAYRQQTGYNPLIITTEQLYEQFYYGIHHPLAIKNFAKYLLQYASTKPKYLLLLGKGLENNLIRSSQGLSDDLVPTFGSPPSDDLLTARINTSSLAPAFVTGRIGAKNNEEVEIYLQKLKTYEQYPNALWRKKFIHISGGANLSENISWANYQTNMFNMAKAAPFGADTVNFSKNVTLPVSSNQKQQIVNEINKGAALLSFLGHGAHQATEINFGDAEDLNNSNRLLTYLVNGCTTGNTYIYEPSLGEKLFFAPEKGAIGWIGTSSEGVASYLSNFSSIFYQNAFTTNYGVSVAEAMKFTKKQYENAGDAINVMHTTQYTFQGDPALKFYNPSKPDFSIENQDLFVSPSNVTALDENFKIGINIKNIGKAIEQPLKIALERTLPDNSVINYPAITTTTPIYNHDIVYFSINHNDISSAGMNRFKVTLDPDNSFDEFAKTNNVATFEYFLAANGVNIIYPKTYAIVSQTNPELITQSNNLLIKNANYIFEIDTVKTFNSPWKKTNQITANFMAKWQAPLLGINNQVYYWRTRLDLDLDKGGAWQESSFTYSHEIHDGWNQSHYQQYNNGTFTSLELNNATKKLEFAKTAYATMIQTRGDDAPTSDERTYRSNPGGRLGYLSYEFVGFTLIAKNPSTMSTFNYPSAYNVENDDGAGKYYSGQFYYDTNNPVAVDSLIAHLNRIPQGFKVMGFNGRGINLSALPQAALDAFKSVGVIGIGNIDAGEPYMFWGVKGDAPGTAIEKTADYSLSESARGQQIKFDVVYSYPLTKGSLVTTPAGPATKWYSAEFETVLTGNDIATFDLIGYDKAGNKTILETNMPGSSIDLSAYDAKDFPKMAIRANFTDTKDRTPAQIKKWRFIYDEVPETTINPDIAYNLYKSKIQEGDSIKLDLGFQNLSKYTSDSIRVAYTLTKPDRTSITNTVRELGKLNANTNETVSIKLPTLGLVGNNLLKVDFIPKNQNDSYAFNNFIQQEITVTKDNKEPTVDVIFDGKHIMNGEIVSAKPTINISLSDENPFILLTDTTAITVYLKTDNGASKRIAYSSGQLNFTPGTSINGNKASVTYKPLHLDDDVYTLVVEARDASGNRNSTNDYTINFEVVNEASVSNFYPYPNPFSTAMKFVFTLTGDKVPHLIKVQIMTISGKIVREVFKEELGHLRIGNNISDFTWDGTDMYGDKLANGVYFYKVTVEDDNHNNLKHRKTSGDQYFKKNIGKIYLMR